SFIISFLLVPPTTEIYPLSLHDALPISVAVATWSLLVLGLIAWRGDLSLGTAQERDQRAASRRHPEPVVVRRNESPELPRLQRKIGRAHVLNSSHVKISYAVFCLKQKIN